MEETTPAPPRRFARFIKHIILGAVFGGVLSSIPVLSYLNCLFCLLNMAAIVFALWMYLKANPEDTLTNGESVKFGIFAGAGAGLILGLIYSLILTVFGLGAIMSGSGAEDQVTEQLASAGIGIGCFAILFVPVMIILFAAFGALGAFLGMQLFFKTRLRQS